jgi:hypothetical protein
MGWKEWPLWGRAIVNVLLIPFLIAAICIGLAIFTDIQGVSDSWNGIFLLIIGVIGSAVWFIISLIAYIIFFIKEK